MKEPKQLIVDVNFDFKKGDKIGDGEVSYNPHIAYTLQSQNGAASGMNTAFLLKSDDLNISEEDKRMIEDIKVSEVKKLAANKETNLRAALKERFPQDEEKYMYSIWVDTFDETHVYFEKDCKTYSLPYTSGMNDMVQLGDVEPTEVVRQIKFVPAEMMDEMMNPEMMMRQLMKITMGMSEIEMSEMDISPDMMEMMKSAKQNLVKYSEVKKEEDLDSSEINKGDTRMNEELNIEELLKSDKFNEVLKGLVDEQTKEARESAAQAQEVAKAAQDQLKAKEEAEIVKAKDDLSTVVKSWAVEDELVESIVKGIFGNEQSEALIKAFDSLNEEIKKVKDQFSEKEHGQDVKVVDEDEIQKSKSLVDEIIKRNKIK